MTKDRITRLERRLRDARCRLMEEQPYYSLMLMYFRFIAFPDMKKISTNGRCIYFNPAYIDKLYDYELDYILCHQVMHVVLGQIWREESYTGDDYHFACNIIVNSMLKEQGMLPDRSSHLGQLSDIIPGTHIPGKDFSPEEILDKMIYRVSFFDEKTRNSYMADSDCWWNLKDDFGENGILILDIPEEFPLVSDEIEDITGIKQKDDDNKGFNNGENSLEVWISRSKTAAHFIFKPTDNEDEYDDTDVYAGMPGFLRRMFEMQEMPQIDWRQLLNDFIQERVCDYSFAPPDRRFSDTDFFLPDFNEKEFIAKDVLFMVDTSGSVGDEELSRVYTEICSACEQFSGKLSGKLGFFDMCVTEPLPFESVGDILSILPYGGGGTNFTVIFDYIQDNYYDNLPSCVIIFTDGEGPYPDEEDALGVPTMWVLDNNDVTPPFGKTIRIIPNGE